MKVSCTFTLTELQRVTPSLRQEHFTSTNPKVQDALKYLFWHLGCTVEDKYDIVEGVTTKNRYGELDDSIRINVHERQDSSWLQTRYASHQAKVVTNDISLMKDIDSISNQRSYDSGLGED